MKKLPIGIQTFRDIIEENYVYIDKTGIALDLIESGKYYFLSRPRRFGKSLFVDTLKEIFEGNEPLFKGLSIHDRWDWSQKYPVIKIDFSAGTLQNRGELDIRIYDILDVNVRDLKLNRSCDKDIAGTFVELINQAEQQYGNRPVILIDEYDKPILDNIENPEVAASMREGLKNFYSVLKGQDAHIAFVFMTGVSKFSKVSVFSGLNQLKDITISKRFASICGYTHEDLEHHFADHLKGVEWSKLRKWYNGYRWLGASVYNPYDILLFIFEDQSYRNYWFETGNPSFLTKLFQQNRFFLPDLASLELTEEILDSFDIETINPVTLLFQAGYLTIAKTFTRRNRMMFKLELPNLEVKIALNDHFINGYTALVNEKIGIQDTLYTCLENGDIDGIIKIIKRLFSSIPYRNFTKNGLADSEGYYASVLYAFFCSLDATVIPEDITNHGQVDMTVKLGNHVYVIEIKVVNMESTEKLKENPALKQIQDMGYADKYRGETGVTVHELGLLFSRKSRNLII